MIIAGIAFHVVDDAHLMHRFDDWSRRL